MPFCNLKNFLLINHGVSNNGGCDIKEKRQLNYSLLGVKILFSAVYCLKVEIAVEEKEEDNKKISFCSLNIQKT